MTDMRKPLSAGELAFALGISEFTIMKLARQKEIPCRYTKNNRPRFYMGSITGFFNRLEKEKSTDARSFFTERYPLTLRSLRGVDFEYSRRRVPAGYNLTKRENKKHGFIYYVRYYHDGRMLPSKWSCGTNDYERAKKFAVENREKIITGYKSARGGEGLDIFKKFYEKDSVHTASEVKRGMSLCERRRRSYENMMVSKFVPFLRERGIKRADGISAGVLIDYQDALLASGLKPQTVNDNLFPVKKVFSYLERKGKLGVNPCAGVGRISVREKDRKARGCYELEKMKGAFEGWSDAKQRLLNMIVYTTGMRNGEIKRIKFEDIVMLNGERFINIKESKTGSGVRLVPLHKKVYEAMLEDGELFGGVSCGKFGRAARALGLRLGMNAEELRERNITFYSGRHFYKTMMSAGGLGEGIEEIFMGHRVTSDISKLYNHKDMRGAQMRAEAARRAFKIIDKYIFT